MIGCELYNIQNKFQTWFPGIHKQVGNIDKGSLTKIDGSLKIVAPLLLANLAYRTYNGALSYLDIVPVASTIFIKAATEYAKAVQRANWVQSCKKSATDEEQTVVKLTQEEAKQLNALLAHSETLIALATTKTVKNRSTESSSSSSSRSEDLTALTREELTALAASVEVYADKISSSSSGESKSKDSSSKSPSISGSTSTYSDSGDEDSVDR